MELLVGMARAFDNAHRDLQVIADRLDVVWDEGWWPAQPDPDQAGGQTPVEHDQIPGAVRDCGLGNYRARQAWRSLTGHIQAADQLTRLLLMDAAARESALQSPVSAPGYQVTQSAIRLLQARLRGTQRLWQAIPLWDARSKWFEERVMGRPGHPIGSPCWHIEQARYQALSVVAIVGNGKRPPVCGRCRKAGTVGDPRRKGWCAACYRQWFRECSPTVRMRHRL